MSFGRLILNCLIVGAIAFAAGILVSFLFNVIIHGNAMVAWGSMFRLAAVIGLVIPIADLVKKGKE